MSMTASQIIVLATPVFLLLMALEFAWVWKMARKSPGSHRWRLNDAMNSLGLGLLSQISAVFTRLFRVGVYTAIYKSVAIYPDQAFWTT